MPSEQITKACPDCGDEVRVELDLGEQPSRLGRKLVSLVRATQVVCVPCGERAENGRESRRAEQRLRERTLRAQVPRDLAGVSFERLDRTGLEGAVADAERWARGELPGLLLAGDVGVGKTWIAAAAANAALAERGLRWVTTPALLARALASDNEVKRQVLDVLTGGHGAIVLDDFDKANSSEWAVAQLFMAVDNAVSQGRPLLVTTNLGATGLTERFGEAITSRLVGYCATHRIQGHDRRAA